METIVGRNLRHIITYDLLLSMYEREHLLAKMEGKVAIVTGAAGGIGKGFAEVLLENGVKVCIIDINKSLGTETEAELQTRFGQSKIFFQACDVTSEQELEDAMTETIRRYKHLDILCNNAGIVNETNWELLVNINLNAMIRGTLLAFKYMGKAVGRDNAVVVNTSSDAGIVASTFMPMYAATKHGVVGFSRSVGGHSRQMYGVRVNCICPTMTETPMTPKTKAVVAASNLVNEDIKKLAQEMTPEMKPRDVADALLELLTDHEASGAVMLVMPTENRILQFANDVDELPYKPSTSKALDT